ncbi:hypothetical protein FSBG_00184 [Fusobacterium gonidiaformans 3-1-5R]|uniref:Phage protein n=1 Tax=Fusobacterium gonidiaformans 3-1-5R TaxID=469605 RepID=E5BF06_9FUSO|nr:hypothetical protein [Fusobacterium gonidiaformans]EFS20687.1 hypothetical protein FSBG_00184 [Fusobacterium gonidiaformans 3-1-5R]
MKNTLADLNNHLFAQLERLSDEDLTDEQLSQEIKRASAISKIATSITGNASIILEAQKLKTKRYELEGEEATDIPKMLEGQ